jgi:hypothetical protein
MSDNITTEQALEDAIFMYRDLAERIKALQEAQAAQKQTIADIFMELNIDKATTNAGKALITAPSITISYNATALDALCASDDGLARLLHPHRKETMRVGTLTIKA